MNSASNNQGYEKNCCQSGSIDPLSNMSTPSDDADLFHSLNDFVEIFAKHGNEASSANMNSTKKTISFLTLTKDAKESDLHEEVLICARAGLSDKDLIDPDDMNGLFDDKVNASCAAGQMKPFLAESSLAVSSNKAVASVVYPDLVKLSQEDRLLKNIENLGQSAPGCLSRTVIDQSYSALMAATNNMDTLHNFFGRNQQPMALSNFKNDVRCADNKTMCSSSKAATNYPKTPFSILDAQSTRMNRRSFSFTESIHPPDFTKHNSGQHPADSDNDSLPDDWEDTIHSFVGGMCNDYSAAKPTEQAQQVSNISDIKDDLKPDMNVSLQKSQNTVVYHSNCSFPNGSLPILNAASNHKISPPSISKDLLVRQRDSFSMSRALQENTKKRRTSWSMLSKTMIQSQQSQQGIEKLDEKIGICRTGPTKSNESRKQLEELFKLSKYDEDSSEDI